MFIGLSAAAPEFKEIVEKHSLTVVPFGDPCHQFYLVRPEPRLKFEDAFTIGEENPMTGFSLPSQPLGLCLFCDGVLVQSKKGHRVTPTRDILFFDETQSLKDFEV